MANEYRNDYQARRASSLAQFGITVVSDAGSNSSQRSYSASASSSYGAYSSGRSGARVGSTRFAEQGSAARKLEPTPQEIPKQEKVKKPGIKERLGVLIKTNDAVPKAIIICLVLVLAATICIPLVGSYLQTAAQHELNSVNKQISDVNHDLTELHEAYLFSIDSNEACAAAVHAGMARVAQSTPVHP